MKTIKLILILSLLTTTYAIGQEKELTNKNKETMKTYVIERSIPGAGDLTPEQLKGISQTSCSVLKEMGPKIEWQHSYVTGDKVYCVYKAENKDLVKEHAKKGGFPANSINEVATVISPATAEQ
ncbi:DUF4242 domain-containing protein [Maribacter sp. HTCC2170]|uniref:DUF4242 domain-containing protein n=1 Tax=Maribacter sp. (strain HTCC2170 / KCCM 42371) TaxID=313603 RepID=UPI00006AFCE6|nr:DUF4242 domain-containing protein [Maribacter sp. HTCC2170]EAR01381.1 hypothetical protein FB2170_11691 [Maribacter sp. HTCC2170]